MGNKKNTLSYFKKEVTPGTPVVPTSGSDGYLAIEPPDVTTGQRETLESELLSGNIGAKKPQLGIETASCAVVTELRSHGDTSNPTVPDFDVPLESAIGAANVSTADAVQAAPAPSTSEFGIATEGSIKRHDFMVIDNATDGKVARFVKELKIDIVVGANDAIDFNEGGAELNATLTPGTYIHGGDDVAGSIGEEIKAELETAGADTYTVTCEEQEDKSYKYTIASNGVTFEILIATGTNTLINFLELNLGFGALDLTGATTYTAVNACWGNRVVVNRAMTTAPTAADVISASVNYKPVNVDHSHFTSGFYQGNSNSDGFLEQVIGCLCSGLGITIETGAIAKINFDISGLSSARTALTKASHTPIFEDVAGMAGFNVECYFDNLQVCGNTIAINLADEISEKKTFCSETGKSGSIVRKRTITGNVNPYSDGSKTFYDALNALTDYALTVVIGKKDANGFIVGQTVGVYLPQISITQDKTGDIDDNLIEEINFSAHSGNSGTERDFILSFA